MTTDLFGPVAIDTNIQLAAMRQIHCAIEHLKEGYYEAAITLAAAAEGMLPETEARHLRQAVKPMSKRPDIQDEEGGSKDPNACIHWLKHGTVDGKRVEAITIPAEESMVIVCRAMTKFNAVFSDMTPQWRHFTRLPRTGPRRIRDRVEAVLVVPGSAPMPKLPWVDQPSVRMRRASMPRPSITALRKAHPPWMLAASDAGFAEREVWNIRQGLLESVWLRP
jgi:hypothetical protein